MTITCEQCVKTDPWTPLNTPEHHCKQSQRSKHAPGSNPWVDHPRVIEPIQPSTWHVNALAWCGLTWLTTWNNTRWWSEGCSHAILHEFMTDHKLCPGKCCMRGHGCSKQWGPFQTDDMTWNGMTWNGVTWNGVTWKGMTWNENDMTWNWK